MPAPRVAPETVEIAEASYRRVKDDDGFFKSFYERLLASDPVITRMFAKTDFDRQHKLLQHALGLLIAYGKPGNGRILDRIAQRHQKHDINVVPSLYPFFVESLVATVRDTDPQFSPAVEQAWRAAIAPGINFLTSVYDAPIG